jgi:ribosomal protein S18 acetylase RimI-like enzyme
MQSTIQIRKMQASDLQRVAQLFDAYRQFYLEKADLPLAEQFIAARFEKRESDILVAELNGQQLVGFSQLYPTFCSVMAQPIYVLYDLFVAPEGRSLGAARMLLDGAVNLARANGKARLDLSTAKTNLRAQGIYEANGWEQDQEFLHYSFTL